MQHPDLGRKKTVQRKVHALNGRLGMLQMHVRDLPESMNSSIRPPTPMHRDLLARQHSKSPFNHLLHGIAIGLPLPTGQVRSVIGYPES
jgi:hypothetical protein